MTTPTPIEPEASEREAFEAWIVEVAGIGAIERWLNTNAYTNDRVQDYRTGWLEAINRLAALRSPAPAVTDACEICHGAKGGVPGNENLIDGKRVCDYCHAAPETPAQASEVVCPVHSYTQAWCPKCRAAPPVETPATDAEVAQGLFGIPPEEWAQVEASETPAPAGEGLTDDQINKLRLHYGVTSDGRGISAALNVFQFARACIALAAAGTKGQS